MMAQVLEMFAQGYEVVVVSYYGDSVVESVEEIQDVFEEAEEDEWIHVEVEIDEEAHRVELFIQCDE